MFQRSDEKDRKFETAVKSDYFYCTYNSAMDGDNLRLSVQINKCIVASCNLNQWALDFDGNFAYSNKCKILTTDLMLHNNAYDFKQSSLYAVLCMPSTYLIICR